MVAITRDQVTQTPVKFLSLRYLSHFHQLSKVLDFSANRKVVIGKFMRSGLQIFGAPCDELGNFVVLLSELSHLIAEFGGFTTAFDLDLTGDSSEFVDVSRADFFLN